MASNHSLEIRYLKDEISSVPIENISSITVVTPRDSSIIDNSIYDLSHLSSSNPDVIHPMLAAAFAEMSAVKELEKISIVVSHHGRKIVKPVIQLVQEGYKGFNIIKFDDSFYGILQGEGVFSVERIQSQDYSIFFVANKKSNIIEKIDQYIEANDRFKRILANQSYREFNELKGKKQLANEELAIEQLGNEELVIDMNKIRLF
ncbi:MAG: hypothetical protein F6J93_40645 [Oscillatoria sp. SIO1A7]|nr:hypothetical protein [Oscillatoria sp. SIO1A7]